MPSPSPNTVIQGPWAPKPRLIHGRTVTWWAWNSYVLAALLLIVAFGLSVRG